jgi:hypothetical protein
MPIDGLLSCFFSFQLDIQVYLSLETYSFRDMIIHELYTVEFLIDLKQVLDRSRRWGLGHHFYYPE